ncbi:ribonuclease P protein subunit p25-like protein isoform X1 [Coccinella septempunctata]|uniref:ribonuclease P protein subunit p25-like protein isoform X1 n=1 Tax=Coccinella septempunctata TaxID=41139 RepID=UPI001D0771C6|nr:ribonuclease P protein subunit p25-like protein isoform X1 [Coccinella septempunctata]
MTPLRKVQKKTMSNEEMFLVRQLTYLRRKESRLRCRNIALKEKVMMLKKSNNLECLNKVRGGTKMRNVLAHMKKFHENKSDDICCIWTGCGPSVEKAISCAEITKRNYDYKLHQVTKICYKTVHEYWDPINPDLDQLVVTRKVPMVHIYLSSKPLDTSESGYQAPGPFAP